MDSTNFSVDRRDISFVQKELFQVQKLFKYKPFTELTEEDMDMVADEGITFAENVFAPINKVGDEQGSHLEDGKVTTPEGFKEAWRQFSESGWLSMNSAPDHGGQGLPFSLSAGVLEALFGANPALFVLTTLTTGAANLIAGHGSPEQIKQYCRNLNSGKWGGTMCLSEPDIGTAVGDLTCKAVKAEGADHYLISGTKQWISGGDHDLSENIVHLVLARTPDGVRGTKGISMFIVPRLRLNDDGSCGEFNNITTIRVDHKLGIRGKPTCVLEFGGSGETWGYLIGNEFEGMRVMFDLMNEARRIVALQGLGSAGGAYRNALAYAHERIQGTSIENIHNPDAERVPIIKHPDVAKTLLTMKAHVEGIRALCYGLLYHSDMANYGPEEDRRRHQDLVDLLTPVAKNMGAEDGFDVVRMGIQVLGGVGYIEEFPLSQALRDTKIASIYEGTSGIQALDLVGRKLSQHGGRLFATFMEEMGELNPEQTTNDQLKKAIKYWGRRLKGLRGLVVNLKSIFDNNGPRHAVLHASDITMFFGDVIIAYLLLKSALIADKNLTDLVNGGVIEELIEQNEDIRFYHNKIKTAQHYVFHILPRTIVVEEELKNESFVALETAL